MIANLFKRLSASGNIYSLAANLIFALFSFVSFLIMVRMLDKATFGQWVIFVTMAALLDMLRLGLAGTAAIRLISANSGKDRETVIGTSYKLSIITTSLIAVVLLLVYSVMSQINPDSIYLVVFLFYPILAFSNLPHNQANVVAQGDIDFRKVFILKTINGALMLAAVLIYISFFQVSVSGLVIVYIAANLLTSGIAIINGWDGLKFIRLYDKSLRAEILTFGKYSTAGYIGSNLLRSSDTVILSLAPALGPEAIAIYAIPLKFVEVVEIPLRSFTATAFPNLSKALKQGTSSFHNQLFQYCKWSTVLFVPAIILLACFPQFFLNLLGGAKYASSIGLQTQILYIICLYILLLPLDRYSGVALFAMDRPDLNFYKITTMLIANIVFDCIAVFVLHSLAWVAVASLAFTAIGIVLGWYTLYRQVGISFKPELLALRIK